MADVARLTAAFILINLPFWLLSLSQFVTRPWFNIELLAPLVLAALERWRAATVCLVFLWFLDAGDALSHTFHFIGALEFLETAEFIPNIRWKAFFGLQFLAMTALFSLCAGAAARVITTKKISRSGNIALVIAVILAVADAANGSSALLRKNTLQVNTNLAFAPTVKLVLSVLQQSGSAKLTALRSVPATSAFEDVPGWMKRNPNRSVVLILVESLGLGNQELLPGWLALKLTANASDYTSRFLPIFFQGTTTNAELRELCSLKGSYKNIDQAKGAECLPSMLMRDGHHTIGIHGFSGNMFNRNKWWPQIGLETNIFAEDFQRVGAPVCGATFAGICDQVVINRAFDEAQKTKNSFVYALTLNSHLPIHIEQLDRPLQLLCDKAKTPNDVCVITQILGRALTSISNGANSSRVKPLVIVVGDHAPPFSSLSSRQEYSATFVPAWIMEPRDAN